MQPLHPFRSTFTLIFYSAMNSPRMDRRQWLRYGSALAAGALVAPSAWASMPSSPNVSAERVFLEEWQGLDKPTQIKARLLANENPYGISAKAKAAITQAIDSCHLYAIREMEELKAAIARKEGVKPEQVLIGAGSTELLDAAAFYYSLMVKGRSQIVSADPGYQSLMATASAIGAEWVKVPLDQALCHDLDRMASAVTDQTSLVYVCNPNNPTGTAVDPAPLASFCQQVSAKAPVFVDEAYFEYMTPARQVSMTSCVKEGHNVLIARTFSKAHAFAGLRVGYLIGQTETLEQLAKFASGGFTLSVLAIRAALASLADEENIAECVRKNTECRAFLYKTLADSDFEYIPSEGNFVLFPLRMKGEAFTKAMSDLGVGVRRWEFNRQHWSRVSVGTMQEMEWFAEAFRQVVG